MNCDLIVVRSKQEGAPRILTQHMDAHVVNGGDGKHQHPTQALLDAFTIRETLGHIDGLKVGIVGDIAHSRRGRVRSCRCSRSWVPSPS